MNEDEKIMWMFIKVHGIIKGRCYTEIIMMPMVCQ